MSHISTYKYQIKDLNTLKKVLASHNAEIFENNGEEIELPMYGSQTAKGVLAFSLKTWKYPLVVDVNGQIAYDNWGSQSGSMDDFNQIVQEYNCEVINANIDHSLFDNVTQTIDENGNIIIEMIEY